MRNREKKKAENKEQNPLHREYGIISNIRYILQAMFEGDRRFLYLIPIGVLCAPFTTYLWTFLSKFIIDTVMGECEWQRLLYLMLGFAAVQTFITMLNTYYDSETAPCYIEVRCLVLLGRLNAKAMKIDFEHLENPDVMDCNQKAKNACGNNDSGVEGMMHQITYFLNSLAVVVVGICILGTMNVFVVLLMLALAGVNFVITNHTNAVAKKVVWDPLAPWWRKRYYIQNTTTNFKEAKDIRMFGLQKWLLAKYRELNKVRYEAQKKNARLWFAASVSSNVLWLFAQLAVYAWLIYAVINGKVTIGNFTLYITSAGTFFGYISSFLNSISNLLARSREVDDYRSFLDFDGGDTGMEGKELPKLPSYEFTFENVSFCYPKSERYVLKDLNLTVKAGERLAVVGKNGAGKSTFIKLLLRLYEPTKGRILLNGVDVREYDKRSYYEAFAPVFQQVELFAFPMAENVSMKEPERTDKTKAKECLVKAGLSEKLKELPLGVDTELLKVISDEGVDLSGGEKQKLALARALYKDAPVVILDEPTAALDALAEAKLYESFDRLIGDKTAVYISHRLSSTQFCSHVAMFEDGEMTEYGTHEELLSKGGAYAEMFRVQAQYYVENPGEEAAYGEA